MKNQVCIVTGANSGIGEETALSLAKLGATVILLCRNYERGNITLKNIISESNNKNVELMLCDLSSQNSIFDFTSKFKNKYDRLNVLINNAGILLNKKTISVDGIENTFAINHLGPFILTNSLLNLLKSSSPSRIINVSSSAHYRANFDIDNLQGEKKYSSFDAYCKSKLYNVLFTYELSRKLAGSNVTVNCLHPGFIPTKLFTNSSFFYQVIVKILSPILIDAKSGSETSTYLATSKDVENITGKYFVKCKPKKSSKISYDKSTSKNLWNLSEKLVNYNKSAEGRI